MSYEGFVQTLCANGHLSERDCLEYDEPCVICGEPAVFTHDVDQTNGYDKSHPSTCRRKFEVDTPAVTEVCNLGHVHVITEATYKIPER